MTQFVVVSGDFMRKMEGGDFNSAEAQPVILFDERAQQLPACNVCEVKLFWGCFILSGGKIFRLGKKEENKFLLVVVESTRLYAGVPLSKKQLIRKIGYCNCSI